MSAPVILVSAGFPAYGDYMGIAYARPLEAAGAVPLHLPFLADAGRALAVADGVLLGFGSDIDPSRYGGVPHPTMTAHSARRDAFELELARETLARELPVLGICRGMQVLNVLRGGTLRADAAPHPGGDWDRWALVRASVLGDGARPEHPGHALRVVRGSRLAAALDVDTAWVNSYHHQALDRLGDGVEPVAWAEDGIVEAIELSDAGWALGVQWELQESWRDDERFLEIFRAFVSATARRAARPAAMRKSLALRLSECSVSRSPSVAAIPTDELVSTTPGKSVLMPSGPAGSAAIRSRMRALSCSVQASVEV